MEQKTKLRQKFLELLQEKFKKNNDKEMKALIGELSGVLAKNFVTKVESEVKVTNQEDASKALIQYLKDNGVDINKPKWYKPVKVNVPDKIKAEIDAGSIAIAIGSVLSTFLGALISGVGKLLTKTFDVRLGVDHYLTPQYVVMINPKTGQPIAPEEMGTGIINMAPALAASGGPTRVGIRGADSLNDGQETVTTAGTRVQLPNIQCSRVFIQSHPANGSLGSEGATVVVGGSAVVAEAVNRRGLALFSTQWQEFQITNLNKIWIDATENGAKINYIYEV